MKKREMLIRAEEGELLKVKDEKNRIKSNESEVIVECFESCFQLFAVDSEIRFNSIPTEKRLRVEREKGEKSSNIQIRFRRELKSRSQEGGGWKLVTYKR